MNRLDGRDVNRDRMFLLTISFFIFAIYTIFPIGYKVYKRIIEVDIPVEKIISAEQNEEIFKKIIPTIEDDGVAGKIFSYRNLLLIEFPFFLLVTFFFFLSNIKSRFVRYLSSLAPPIISYTIFDFFYFFLRRSPRPSDLKNIYTIGDFSFFWLFIAILLLFFCMSYICIYIYNIYKTKRYIYAISFRISIVLVMIIFFISPTCNDFYINTFNRIKWSEEKTIESNGRFSSFIYYMIQEMKNKKKLKNVKFESQVNIYDFLYRKPKHVNNIKNIHLVILESFLDPRLIDDIIFNYSPLSQELAPFMLGGKRFSLVWSPVYGGCTAQAEFELLTGIKALAKIDSIEFNTMMGNVASSFLKKLQEYNYSSIGTIASSSIYYNSRQAYKSLGVNNVVFMKDEFKYKDDDINPVFDGDLFEYNIKRIEPYIKSKQPIFNYVVGMYGHYPYGENVHNFIEVKHENSDVRKISNQFFLRTKALGQYLNKLKTIDPNSIICVVSDHLPAVLDGKTRYKFDKHVNVALFIDSGRVIDISGKKYFEIPPMIWEILSGDKNSFYIDDKTMEKMYFKFLSETIL